MTRNRSMERKLWLNIYPSEKCGEMRVKRLKIYMFNQFIPMEKLIELLNEFEKSTSKVMYIWKNEWTLHYYDNYKDENIFDNVRLKIISKEYWFIQWLCDSRKIDRDKFDEYFEKWKCENIWITWVEDWELIQMLLSISDTPIQDLISFLK